MHSESLCTGDSVLRACHMRYIVSTKCVPNLADGAVGGVLPSRRVQQIRQHRVALECGFHLRLVKNVPVVFLMGADLRKVTAEKHDI